MWSDECWGSRRVSLFFDLHRWFEQIWVYPLDETLSETFEKFKDLIAQTNIWSYEFGLHLKQCGILSQLTPPGTPPRNCVSERCNHTLLDMVRFVMSLIYLLLLFGGYALERAAFTLNRAPSKSIETTPYDLWFGKNQSCHLLKFGAAMLMWKTSTW